MKTEVKIEDALLVTLDGKGDDEFQKQVDAAKLRLSLLNECEGLTPEQSSLVAKIVTYANTSGKLNHAVKQLTFCNICKKSAGYAKYKSGPRKGQNNHDKPLSFYGVDLSAGFVSVRGHASLGCCTECFNSIKPFLLTKLEDVKAEISERITGNPPRFKRYDMRNCKKCGWIGSERLMGKERTLMGDGYYPASCPECGAKNVFLGATVIGHADGFEVHDITP